ncbi:hypothetical protein L873DRAFT_732679 [Choiromyces venosus 120613-1]|uniref:Uncharacterized protein n=1 Tax=Choiromyces venosus 120613-1 TaxID=1336337 RepID=A0A3N4K5A8_9PEZI|nr:hypothetical protein L873DRAFT_732679 [Choiromyces venosus 120613-1]
MVSRFSIRYGEESWVVLKGPMSAVVLFLSRHLSRLFPLLPLLLYLEHRDISGYPLNLKVVSGSYLWEQYDSNLSVFCTLYNFTTFYNIYRLDKSSLWEGKSPNCSPMFLPLAVTHKCLLFLPLDAFSSLLLSSVQFLPSLPHLSTIPSLQALYTSLYYLYTLQLSII